MPIDILVTIMVTAVIQSLLGAGVLLYGTAILLLLGYGFTHTLVIVLPVAIGINVLQLAKDHRFIDYRFYRQILVLSLPFIAVSLFVATHFKINIGVLVGLFLFLIAAKEFRPEVSHFVAGMMRFEKTYFVVMGIVHGLSNLGGSMLTAIVHQKNYEKDVARATIASAYATFAVIQLLTLSLFTPEVFVVPFYEIGFYVVISGLLFMLTESMLYMQLSGDRFKLIFAVFLAISGVLLIIKALLHPA